MMTKPRLDGIYLLLIGTLLFLILGIALEQNSPHAMQDFRVLYNPARCLLQHCDPYNEREVLRLYREEGGDQQSETPVVRVIVTRYIYPPTAFLCTVPFASLPWRTAHILWMTFTLGGIIVASFFAWDLGATYAPILSSVMVGFLLINSVSIVISGNSAGLAVSLCVVAVWCFMRERIRVIGILCLAISLAIKPHDTGLVWLLFFFAGGVYRKRALQALAVLAALSLPLVIWVSEVSPRWVQDMQSNLSSFSVHGGLNDPSPSAAVANGPGMLTNLQALFSVYRDDPHFYNLATYAVCAPLLLLWAFMVLRTRTSQAKVWLALAAIVTLTLLPIYH
ncbi:MAG: glycosyltransferase family 87 protein, partial [Terracidiphilus sp.]